MLCTFHIYFTLNNNLKLWKKIKKIMRIKYSNVKINCANILTSKHITNHSQHHYYNILQTSNYYY